MSGALARSRNWQKAVIALANKHARIVSAMLVRGKSFDARHVSQWPEAAAPSQA
ncbi:MAG: hypothetical protein JNJ71_13700 [Rubrivivax sp.]|nr:hypothetical protein [Rubrivivax sp.]